MSLQAAFVDARPPYVSGSCGMSLLQLPLGLASLHERLQLEVVKHARTPPLVIASFAPEPDYLAAMGRLGVPERRVVSLAGLVSRAHTFEASDWLLIRDSAIAGAEPLDLAPLVADIAGLQGSARHLVVPAGTSGGTIERLLLDGEGRLVRIQRYYERVTWPFAAGVACSLVPVASLIGLRSLDVASLSELRVALASAGVPSRDVFMDCAPFSLKRESGYLGLVERVLQPPPARARVPAVAQSARVHATAVLRGAVVLGEGVEVEAGAVVVGPSVLGRNCRIGEGSVIAQSVVTPGTDVPAGSVARQRVVGPAQVAGGALVDDSAAREPSLPTAEDGEIKQSPYLRFAGLRTLADRAGCLVGLVVLSPLLALIAAAVKLSSPGPVFYGDPREGLGGRAFRCWKFRTMQADAQARQRELLASNQLDGPQFKIDNDPRTTPLGHWLRRLNLDELPQLFNVVCGEMSLVGPRPSPFRENQICVPWREARLSVRPGITGLWQVCRERSASGDFHQWIHYDLLYVEHVTPWLDLKILLATSLTLANRRPVPLHWLVRETPPHTTLGQRAT